MSDSCSVKIAPRDSRCRYWAKIRRNGESLPRPVNVTGASDIPDPYLRNGDEELFEGDILFEGEENHHRKQRGWSYWVSACLNGRFFTVQPASEIKAALKLAGLPADLLPGSGDIAACVRIAHGIRLGLYPAKTTTETHDTTTQTPSEFTQGASECGA